MMKHKGKIASFHCNYNPIYVNVHPESLNLDRGLHHWRIEQKNKEHSKLVFHFSVQAICLSSSDKT